MLARTRSGRCIYPRGEVICKPRQAKEGKGTTVQMRYHRLPELHRNMSARPSAWNRPTAASPTFALLTGRKLKSVIAHGKHLAYDFGRDLKLHVHMGRFGDFTEGKMPYPEVKGVLRMRWSTATDWLELRGATDVLRLYRRPVASGRSPPGSRSPRAQRRPRPGHSLHTQGQHAHRRSPHGPNSLRRHRKHLSGRIALPRPAEPFRTGQGCSRKNLNALWRDAVKLHARRHGGPQTRHHPRQRPAQPKRQSTGRDEVHYVYRRHGRPASSAAPSSAIDLAGRTLYWCPTCQPGKAPAPRKQKAPHPV